MPIRISILGVVTDMAAIKGAQLLPWVTVTNLDDSTQRFALELSALEAGPEMGDSVLVIAKGIHSYCHTHGEQIYALSDMTWEVMSKGAPRQ